MEMIVVPLNKLTVSDLNVRKTGTKDIADLKANIRENGLISRVLSVVATEKEGHYAVIAGGRRLRALKELAKDKLYPNNLEVECIVKSVEEAATISLSENVIRAAMHPADQFEAFKQLADSGKTITEIASVYGVSEVLVKKRLKLASVAPSILKAFRADKIDLEQVMAYTLTDDQERQEAVFRSNPDMNAYRVRRTLTEGDIPLTDKRVTFVGLDAYSEAGGGFYQDLFSDGEAAYLTDAALLDRLFDEKLQQLIEDIRAEGWQGVEIDNDYYTLNSRYPDRIYPKPRALTESEEDELSTLRQEHGGLVARHNDEPDNVKFGVRMDEIDKRIAELSVEEFDPAEVVEAYAVITMEYSGEVKVRRGLMKRARKSGGTIAQAPATDLDGHPKVSEKLGTELAAIRTTMLAADLASNPQVALAATVHAMAAKLFYSKYSASALEIKTDRAAPEAHIENVQNLAPMLQLKMRFDTLREKAPASFGESWRYFLEMQQAQLLEHLALFSALSLKAYSTSRDQLYHADQLATALGTDPASHVTLNDLGYFNRTAKKHIVSVVETVKGEDKAENLATMKKARWPSVPPPTSTVNGFPLASSSRAILPISRCRTWTMWTTTIRIRTPSSLTRVNKRIAAVKSFP